MSPLLSCSGGRGRLSLALSLADWGLEPTSQCRCADVAMADRGRPRTPGTGGGKPPGDAACPAPTAVELVRAVASL